MEHQDTIKENEASTSTSSVIRRPKKLKIDADEEDERNLRRTSYLRATKDLDSDYEEDQDDFTVDTKNPEVLKQAPSIQKIFSVFTKIVEPPLSPTNSSSRLEDFAKTDGWLELKIVEEKQKVDDRPWKNVFVVLKGQMLHFYKDKTTSRENPSQFEETPLNISECRSETSCDLTKKRTVLKLKPDNGPEYFLQTESDVLMQSWIQVIEELSIGESKQKRWARRSITSRNRSPSSQSPVNKFRKASADQSLLNVDKDNRRSWKGKMSRPWRRNLTSSPTTVQSYPEGGSIGVPLEECPLSSDPATEQVPKLVHTCCSIVEEKGLNTVGIYRIPGNSAAVLALTEQVNRGPDHFNFEDCRWSDVNVVSSLLKSFFRKLPDPIFTLEMYSVFVEMSKIEDSSKRLSALKNLVHELPDCNFETLKFFCNHLCKIIKQSENNKMDLRNLAIVFGPTLVRTSDDNMLSMVTDMAQQCRIIESILSNCQWFFSNEEMEPQPELQSNEALCFGDVTPTADFTHSSYQSLLLTNLQKLEDSEKSGSLNLDIASAKDLMSGILSAANRKMLRATSGNSKMKKGSVDSSAAVPSTPPANKSQLWLDLAEPEVSGSALRPNLHGAGTLLASVPQLMGHLVGSHHPTLTTIPSSDFCDSPTSSCERKQFLETSKNLPDQNLKDFQREQVDQESRTSSHQEPYRREANSLTHNRLVNFPYLNLSQIPAHIALNTSKESADLTAKEMRVDEAGSLLNELTATFDEKLRQLLDPDYQDLGGVNADSSQRNLSLDMLGKLQLSLSRPQLVRDRSVTDLGISTSTPKSTDMSRNDGDPLRLYLTRQHSSLSKINLESTDSSMSTSPIPFYFKREKSDLERINEDVGNATLIPSQSKSTFTSRQQSTQSDIDSGIQSLMSYSAQSSYSQQQKSYPDESDSSSSRNSLSSQSNASRRESAFGQTDQESIESTSSSSTSVHRRKSELALFIATEQSDNTQSPQRSLSLDHGSVDIEAIQQQLDALNFKLRSKKSDLKRGKLVDKSKEPFMRHRNNSMTVTPVMKPNQNLDWIGKLDLNPVLHKEALDKLDDAKYIQRRHTIGGIEDLLNELKYVKEEKNGEDKTFSKFSFSQNIANTYQDWKCNLRLRSSSPDLISINSWSIIEMDEISSQNEF